MRSIRGHHRARQWAGAQRARAAGRRNAVTLIELLIVTLVIGILAAAAAPSFVDSLMFHRVESAARRVKSDLELARHTARLTSATQSVTFANLKYALTGTGSLDRPAESYVVDLAAEPYHLDGMAADFNGAPSITFDGYGTPASGGTIVFTAGQRRRSLLLDGNTGEATLGP